MVADVFGLERLKVFMIIIKLNGGLGNQMFQYAFGRAYSLKCNIDMKLDITWFEKVPISDTKRNYELDIFSLPISFAKNHEIKDIKGFTSFLPDRFFKLLHRKFPFLSNSYCPENSYSFDPSILKCRNHAYFEGYWQSYKYFDSFRDIILKDFTYTLPISIKTQQLEKIILQSNSISLHVRRGDYVSNAQANSYHGVASLIYYKDAISYISKRIEKIQLFIFSDDIAWVKEHLNIDMNVLYVDYKKNAFEDIYLMSKCKHNIIANSSFSWWGAYLNENESKIVIAPKQWFTDLTIDTTDLIPSEWVRL